MNTTTLTLNEIRNQLRFIEANIMNMLQQRENTKPIKKESLMLRSNISQRLYTRNHTNIY